MTYPRLEFIVLAKGPSINYVTLKSGKIDSQSPPVTPPSRMPKKMDAPPRDVTFLGHFHITPLSPQIENLNKESRNKVNFKRMFIMLRKQCTLLMQNSENVEEKKYWAWRHGFSLPPHILPSLTVTKSVYPPPPPPPLRDVINGWPLTHFP